MTEKRCGNCHWYHEDSRGIGIGTCLNMNSERMCSGNYFPCAHAKNYPCNHHASESSTLYNMWVTDEEIVRCGDCKHCDPEVVKFSDGESGSDCVVVAFCDLLKRETCLQNFCSWGERRE